MAHAPLSPVQVVSPVGRVAPKMRREPKPVSVFDDWTESEFQRHVVRLAQDHGWGISTAAQRALNADLAAYSQPSAPLDGLVFHPRIMYRTEPGWPDLTLIRRRDRRLIFAELKRESGKLTPRQAEVLDLLQCLTDEEASLTSLVAEEVRNAAVRRIQVFIWRPSDLAAITEVLR